MCSLQDKCDLGIILIQSKVLTIAESSAKIWSVQSKAVVLLLLIHCLLLLPLFVACCVWYLFRNAIHSVPFLVLQTSPLLVLQTFR